MRPEPPEGTSGSIWLDTDNANLGAAMGSGTGSLFWDAGPIEIDADFPNGFRANDRFVRWEGEPVERSGTVSCASGTKFHVTTAALFTIDVDRHLC